MSLSGSELDAIVAWVRKAKPRSGVYYRSVSYKYMDPKTVLNGAGTAAIGGRFASVGTKAVYLSESDSAASNEVIARKARLGTDSQIFNDKYPRIVFRVAFDLKMVLDLSQPVTRGLAPIREKCLDVDDLTASQEFGDLLQSHGIDGLIFPSVVGAGLNMVVYKGQCAVDALKLENEAELLTSLTKITEKSK